VDETNYVAIQMRLLLMLMFILLTRWIKIGTLTMKPQCVTIQMKAIEQYFYVVLIIMLYKVVLTFTSVDKTLVCDHSNESY